MNFIDKATSSSRPYLLALAMVILAAVFRFALNTALDEHAPLLVFILPVAVCALYLGMGPAIFATVLGCASGAYLFMNGIGFDGFESTHLFAMGLFLAISLVISFLGRELKASQQSMLLANRLLGEESKRKDEFLAMLAHELRNPLAAVSAANALLKFVRPEANHVVKTHDVISRQIKHMTKLIDDLVDVSRVTRGLIAIEKKPVDLKDVIDAAIDQVQASKDARQQHLSIHLPSDPVFVTGDQTRLVQVIGNLLNNAIKYTPPSGEIELRLKADKHWVELQVEDNGAGLSPELLPRVFDLFVQGERSLDRSQGGLGIGLALVKSIAELHDGKVAAYSEGADRGSRFILTLPRLMLNQVNVDQEEYTSESNTGNSFNILLVDDNRDAAQSLAMLLELQGHTLYVEHDSRRALDCAYVESLDVLLLDIGLPGMNGYELAKRLRSMPHLAGATFIALTGYGQETDKEQAMAAGFDYHFAKPLEMSSLTQLLGKISPNPLGRPDHLVGF